MIRVRRPDSARLLSAPRAGMKASPTLVWLALGSLYVIWGSTYLAIRLTIRTLPPLLSASVRFLVAGGLLYAWAIRRGERAADRPGPRQWLAAAIVGGLLILGGNGAVVWAERRVPSGIVALIIALIPLWMALIDRFFYGQRLAPQAVVGLILGFGALALLAGGGGGGRFDITGVLVAVGAALSWAIGSLYARKAPLPKRPLVGTGMEMIAGGILLGLVGIAGRELSHVHPSQFSMQSLLALGYLVVFGSWIGFSSYLWLLRVAPTSLVSTYAYVNPVVAVLLGWAFVNEDISARVLVAGLIIVLAVALIITARPLPPGEPADAAPDAAAVRRDAS